MASCALCFLQAFPLVIIFTCHMKAMVYARCKLKPLLISSLHHDEGVCLAIGGSPEPGPQAAFMWRRESALHFIGACTDQRKSGLRCDSYC